MFNVRVEYECTPIRHIAVQCPKCRKWFHGRDITKDKDRLQFDYQIKFAEFICPICGEEFGGIQHADKLNIQEVMHPEIYEGCLRKREVWD